MKAEFFEDVNIATLKQMDHDAMLMVHRNAVVLSNVKVGDEVTYLDGFQTISVHRRRGVVAYIHPEGRYIGIRLYGTKHNGHDKDEWLTCAKPFEVLLDVETKKNEKIYNTAA